MILTAVIVRNFHQHSISSLRKSSACEVLVVAIASFLLIGLAGKVQLFLVFIERDYNTQIQQV